MKIYLLFFILFFSQLNAEVNGNKFDHIYSGCPINSICNKELGIKRQNWIKFLRSITEKTKNKEFKKFQKKYGVPLNIWTTNKAKMDPSIIQWDSPCRGHRIEGQEINKGQTFVNSFKPLLDSEKIIVSNIYLLDEKLTLMKYPYPRDVPPSFMTNRLFFYNLSDEAELFGIKAYKKGHVELTRTTFPKQVAEEVSCPDQLANLFLEIKKHKNLYQGHFCKAIWNTDTRKYQTILLGWTCS